MKFYTSFLLRDLSVLGFVLLIFHGYCHKVLDTQCLNPFHCITRQLWKLYIEACCHKPKSGCDPSWLPSFCPHEGISSWPVLSCRDHHAQKATRLQHLHLLCSRVFVSFKSATLPFKIIGNCHKATWIIEGSLLSPSHFFKNHLQISFSYIR